MNQSASKLTKFFRKCECLEKNSTKLWTHQYDNKCYRLTEGEASKLKNLSLVVGEFINLEEKNVQYSDGEAVEQNLRFVLDIDFPKEETDIGCDVAKFLKIIIREFQKLFFHGDNEDAKIYGVWMRNATRYHLHLVNLVFAGGYQLGQFKRLLLHECFREMQREFAFEKSWKSWIDAKAGNSHFLMHGSLKIRGKNVRTTPYKCEYYFVISKNRFDVNRRWETFDAWPYYTLFNFENEDFNLRQLLSLQRKVDENDVLLSSLDSLAIPPSNICGKNSAGASPANVDPSSLLSKCKKKKRKRTEGGEEKEDNDDGGGSGDGGAGDEKKRRSTMSTVERAEYMKRMVCASPKQMFFQNIILECASTYSQTYDDWIKIGYIIVNEYGGSMFGETLFDVFSQSCPKKYDFHGTREKYQHLASTFDAAKKPYLYSIMNPPLDAEEEELSRIVVYECQETMIDSVVRTMIQRVKMFKTLNTFAGETDYYVYREGKYEVIAFQTIVQNTICSVNALFKRLKWHNYARNYEYERLSQREKEFLDMFGKLGHNNIFHHQFKASLVANIPDRRLNHNILNFPNYYYDLEKARYRRHRDDFLATYTIDLDPQNDVTPADEELLESLFRTWFANDEHVVEKRNLLDRSLLKLIAPGNHYDRAIFTIRGPTGGGKTLMARIVGYMFDNLEQLVVTLPHQELLAHKSEAITGCWEHCRGDERVILINDFDVRQITSHGFDKLKNITGSDTIRGRRPYGKSNYTKLIQAKPFITTNTDFVLDNSRLEIVDRLHIVTFPNTIRNVDRNLMRPDTIRRLGQALLAKLLAIYTEEKLNTYKLATDEYRLPKTIETQRIVRGIILKNDMLAFFICYNLEEVVVMENDDKNEEDENLEIKLKNPRHCAAISFDEFYEEFQKFVKNQHKTTKGWTSLKLLSALQQQNVKIDYDDELKTIPRYILGYKFRSKY